MAINWRIKNKLPKRKQLEEKGDKKSRRNVPFFGIGIFLLALLFSLLLLDYLLYKDTFKTASLMDMTNGKYREDAAYVDTCVGMFHDLVQDTFYRDGYFYTEVDENDSSLKIYDRVQKLRSTRGIYTYANQGHNSYLRLNVRSRNEGYPNNNGYVHGSLVPHNVTLTFYNNGNAYSGRKIDSFLVKEQPSYSYESGDTDTPNRFGMTIYKSGQRDFMVLASDRSRFSLFPGKQSVQCGVVTSNGLKCFSEFGELLSETEGDSFVFMDLSRFAVRKNKEGTVDAGMDYLYTVSNENGQYTAELDVSLSDNSIANVVERLSKQEVEGGTLSFKEVWNSIFALAEYVPKKTPLLFLSYDEGLGFLAKGNKVYVNRYNELYGTEYVEKFKTNNAKDISSKRYVNKKTVYAIYQHEKRPLKSIITTDRKIIALFADQKFNLRYKESPLYPYELAAVVLRCSIMVVPIIVLASVCFFVIGIYRRRENIGQSVRVLAMGFMPLELRGVLLLGLCCGLIYCYAMLGEKQIYRYISPFFLLMLLIFVGSTVCWWRMDKEKVYSNSWVVRLADYLSEKTRAYYRTHGMSFFLGKRSNRFACCELVLGVLILVACILRRVIGGSFVIPLLHGQSTSLSVWTIVILFLVAAMLLVFLFYLRFLAVFAEGLHGVERQLDLIGKGDFETVVPLPENFYGFEVEEQFEQIKNGMQSAMEGEMRSERMKIDLVANVSHDIKTPLTSIINYVDLLADSKELSPVEADYVRILQRKSYRLRSMIQDLFDLSKATSGNLSVDIRELNFTKLIQQTMADMQESIEASELQFKCNLLEQVHIMSDGNRLYRVLQNLINNAINYSMEGSRVYLNLDVVDDHAVFSIKNMSREELNFTKEQVMERFFRGDQSRSSEGSGLGVAIANSFVEVCGGRFDINIDADLFCATITIPVVTPDLDESLLAR